MLLRPLNNVNVVLEHPITSGDGNTQTVSDIELYKSSSDSARYPGKQLEGYQEELRNGERMCNFLLLNNSLIWHASRILLSVFKLNWSNSRAWLLDDHFSVQPRNWVMCYGLQVGHD